MEKVIPIPSEWESVDVQMSFNAVSSSSLKSLYSEEQWQVINDYLKRINSVSISFMQKSVVTLEKQDQSIVLKVKDELWN